MGRYFDLFPRVAYNLGNKRYSNFQNVTNILFRVGVIRDVLSNVSSYYEYLIKETDTPDILAFNVYGDSEAHWLILLTNQILDPQYEWPLNSRDFNNYIIDKYGSIEAAQTTIHHYEKIIVRENQSIGVSTETRFNISESRLTDVSLTVSNITGIYQTGEYVYIGDDESSSKFRGFVSSYDSTTGIISLIEPIYGPIPNIGETIKGQFSNAQGILVTSTPQSKFETYDSFAEGQYVETFNLGGGRTVIQTTSRNAVSNYDYELELNEQRRSIKIIKPEYYTRIVSEFENLTQNADSPFLRRLA